MTKEREALKLTLDELERYATKRQDDRFAELITKIKEALAQPSDSVEPKPDLNFYYHVDNETHLPTFPTETFHLNLKLTFDGETGKLKSAEVIS